MRELKEDPFYQVLKSYPDCRVEYFLLGDDRPYRGKASHREAVLFAIGKIAREMDLPWDEGIGRAEAEPIGTGELLAFPGKPWKHSLYGTVVWDVDFGGGKIPYWYAFLEPPYGTGTVILNGKAVRKEYGKEEFETVNAALFPNGTERLEIYDWTTDWSGYFDAGREWWGTACWSVYDGSLDRYAVILASDTD